MTHVNPDTPARLYAEQVSLLYYQAPLAYAVTLLNGLILVVVQRAYTPLPVLIAWFTGLVVVTASRASLIYFAGPRITPRTARYWGGAYLVGVGGAGLLWGSTAVWLFPVDALGHQVFLALVLAGMAAGGIAVLSPRIEACVVFLLPTLLPLASRWWLQDTHLAQSMAIMTIIFLGGLLSTAWTMSQFIRAALQLRFDNRELVAEIAKRHQVEERLFQEKDRLQITLASLGEGVVITQADARIEYLNPMAERLSGWSSEAVRGRRLQEVFCSRDEQTQQVIATAVEHCLQRAAPCQQQAVFRTRGEPHAVLEEIATPLRDRAGQVTGAVAIYRDITPTRRLTAQLVYQATHDVLTHLPNRALLKDRLTQAIAHAQRAHQQVAVLFLDVDHFKTVNDTVGHPAGDTVLKAVATRLQSCVRQTDTVARLGGDEFVIVLENVPHDELVMTVARKVLTALEQPFPVDSHTFFLSASLGMTLFPRDGQEVDTLLKHADTALYGAKAGGRNTARFFAADMNQRAVEALTLEQQLRQALERQEFELHYQPQLDVASGQIVGVEALLRWPHPQQGLIPPSSFVPLAEARGLLIPLGEWVIATACLQAKAWQTAGLPAVRMAINLSPRQFLHPGLLDTLASALETSRLAAPYLELELTEQGLMKDLDRAMAIMQALQRHGIGVAMDDFGTGYSSLSYLKHFPVARLKLDRSFVRQLPTNPDDAAITRAVIAMAHSLHLPVVAEGVETDAQWQFLKAQHCDQIQGFYFSRPLPAAAMTALLQSRAGWKASAMSGDGDSGATAADPTTDDGSPLPTHRWPSGRPE